MNQVAYLLLNAIPTYPNNSLSWTRHRRVRRNTAAAEVQIPRRGWVKWHNDWCLGRWKWLADFAARKWWHLIVFTLWPPAMSTKPASFLSISWCFLLKHEVSIAIPLLEEKRRVSQHSWKLTFLLGTPKVIPPIGLCGGYWPLSALMNVASWERIRDGHPQSSGAWHKRFKREKDHPQQLSVEQIRIWMHVMYIYIYE